MPGSAVKAPLSMLYSPPLIEILTGTLRPATVMLSDVTVAERATPVCCGNANESGVVSAARTVARNGVMAGEPTASAITTKRAFLTPADVGLKVTTIVQLVPAAIVGARLAHGDCPPVVSWKEAA